jgi:hypothetical protein
VLVEIGLKVSYVQTITRARYFFHKLKCVNFSLTINVCYLCFFRQPETILWLNNIL